VQLLAANASYSLDRFPGPEIIKMTNLSVALHNALNLSIHLTLEILNDDLQGMSSGVTTVFALSIVILILFEAVWRPFMSRLEGEARRIQLLLRMLPEDEVLHIDTIINIRDGVQAGSSRRTSLL
jgi:hypothetical protein